MLFPQRRGPTQLFLRDSPAAAKADFFFAVTIASNIQMPVTMESENERLNKSDAATFATFCARFPAKSEQQAR